MSPTYIRLHSIKDEICSKLSRIALVFFLLFFLVDTMDAQPAGPQSLRLIGTIQSGNFTGAVFSDEKGEQSFFRVFATLPDGSQIVKVRSDSIALKGSDGTSYDMYIAHDMTRSPVANTAAPVRPDVPADSYVPPAIQKATPEPGNTHARPRNWRDKARSNEKNEE